MLYYPNKKKFKGHHKGVFFYAHFKKGGSLWQTASKE